MRELFEPGTEAVFQLFSSVHQYTLAAFLLMIILLFSLRKPLRNPRINVIARVGLFLVLIISEISLQAWLWWSGHWSYQYSLPLHLSSISLILSALLLLTKRYALFEFTYFVGVGSALQAMITPDISLYTFPHYRYIHFFVSHGGTVVANLFMVFVAGYRPTGKSIWKAFLWLNVYTLIVFIVNFLIEGNYMYISEKPVNPSLIDYLGPWPWYILSLEAITLVTFFILYLPFWLTKRLDRQKPQQ
ncbi:TIGR02206 family membrane protein [Mesobacillus boroniphilus]|uniref:TIGR02206 family membrane protein n=1 Tax=Mesobacillus boroniphilus TaxID=308892 RepID=A0A944GXL6_9BACI|nr:TIGR02206 family membrane protein [Mesobacillus boroniphilus]MBS8265897.1 TIGR02206 family membrane protein [Mesobacillus boroniphilus]